MHADHDPLEDLDALLVAFAHLDVHPDRVARLHVRPRRHLRLLDQFDRAHCRSFSPFPPFAVSSEQRPLLVVQRRRSSSSGRRSSVRCSAVFFRHRRTSSWWPDSSTSGTFCPRTPPGACSAGNRATRAKTSPRPTDRSSPTTPGHQPADRVDHHQRRQLAAAQHVIANRELLGGHQRRGRVRPSPRIGRRAARDAAARSSAPPRPA